MPEYLAPGVYVEETSFRSKSIEGVSTTTTGFVGPTRYGPSAMVPDIITSLAEFERIYGDGEQLRFTGESARRDNYVWHAARAFFDNGGRRLYVVRVVDATATQAGNPPFAAEVALVGTGVVKLDGTLANAPILPGSVRLTNRETVVAGETLGSGDGAAATFDFTLANAPNAANVVIRWTSGGAAKSATIAGATATGDGTPASTTIDRATGQIHLDATGALPDDTTDILAAYQYVDAAIISDDGAGKFAGFATSSIDYDTGAVSLTFASATGAGTTWLAAYTQAKVYARFPGAAGNGTVAFAARPGPNLMAVAGTLPSSVVDGDIVQINGERDAAQNVVWRRVTAGTPKSFVAIRGASAAVNLSTSVTQVAKAASISVSFTPTGARAPNGVWDGLEPNADALCDYFSAMPASDAQARTLPLIIDDIRDTTLHDGALILSGGSDGKQPDASLYEGAVSASDVKTGLKAFEDIEDISIVAAPGLAGLDSTGAQAGILHLQSHVERMRYRVAIVDSRKAQSIGEVRQFRAGFDSKHMAFYYPWVKILDPITRKEIVLPPSGFVAGIYARNDIERAVWKAPANEVVNGAIGFELMLNKAQQEVLNPEGINCFRYFEGRGMRLWGARTMSSDPEWKYVNVRRYFAYLEHSIDKGTQWAVFEPNGERLWANVRRTIEDFLFNEWQMGALLGDKPEKAYFVRCDRSTMTQNDLDNGRLVCLIGVAPLKPAEFVIFRIGQWTADAKL